MGRKGRSTEAAAMLSMLPKFELVPMRTYFMMLPKLRRPSATPSWRTARLFSSTEAIRDALGEGLDPDPGEVLEPLGRPGSGTHLHLLPFEVEADVDEQLSEQNAGLTGSAEAETLQRAPVALDRAQVGAHGGNQQVYCASAHRSCRRAIRDGIRTPRRGTRRRNPRRRRRGRIPARPTHSLT